jgi:hypothetical protein
VKELQIEQRHSNHSFASAPLLAKFVSEGAAKYHELRKGGTAPIAARTIAHSVMAVWDVGTIPHDHIVGTQQCRSWHFEAERLRGLEVEDELARRAAMRRPRRREALETGAASFAPPARLRSTLNADRSIPCRAMAVWSVEAILRPECGVGSLTGSGHCQNEVAAPSNELRNRNT